MPVSLQFDGRQENIRDKEEKRRKTYESISVEDNDQKFSSADMAAVHHSRRDHIFSAGSLIQ